MTKSRGARSKDAAAKPAAPHHTILSLEISGGFLKGLELDFADGLNCIIGGRGTGKTTVLELIRYALSLMPDEKDSPARARAVKAIVQHNLGNGRVRLCVQTKDGMRYFAERAWNEPTRISNEAGEPTAISFESDLIFTADVYSQNEIEAIATNPSFQLALIDKFIDADVRRIEDDLRKLQRSLDANAGELLRLDHEIEDAREACSELPALEEKLKGLQLHAGADAQAVNAAHAQRTLREKERKTVEELRRDLSKVSTDVDALASNQSRRLKTRVDADVAGGPNKDRFTAIVKDVTEVATLLERFAAEVTRLTSTVEASLTRETQTLAERHAKQEATYRELVAKLEEQTGKATERVQIQSRYAEVIAAGKELELRKKEREHKQRAREDLTTKLAALRDERYALRKQVAERLNKELSKSSIRVSIAQSGNRDAYRTFLTEALKGQSMRYGVVVEKIVQNAAPDELCVFIHSGDASGLAERIEIDEPRASRVVDAFRGSNLLYQLETIELEDLPRIETLNRAPWDCHSTPVYHSMRRRVSTAW